MCCFFPIMRLFNYYFFTFLSSFEVFDPCAFLWNMQHININYRILLLKNISILVNLQVYYFSLQSYYFFIFCFNVLLCILCLYFGAGKWHEFCTCCLVFYFWFCWNEQNTVRNHLHWGVVDADEWVIIFVIVGQH